MITFKILFLLCLAIICHMVSSTAVIKSIDLKSRTEHDIQVSNYYTSYPTGSNFLNSSNHNHNQKQDSLPLHLTKPVLVQVYNYGPGKVYNKYIHRNKKKDKIDIFLYRWF